jgi:hypothetical protein
MLALSSLVFLPWKDGFPEVRDILDPTLFSLSVCIVGSDGAMNEDAVVFALICFS